MERSEREGEERGREGGRKGGREERREGGECIEILHATQH